MKQTHQIHPQHIAGDLVRGGIVAAVYIVLTFVLAPLSFGPLGIRLSEGLNFLALYNKRYIYAITLGVFVVNYFSYGVWDMVVGSLSSLVFLTFGRWIADWVAEWITKHTKYRNNPMLIKYGILIVIFSASMFTIAMLTVVLGFEAAFWPTYIFMMVTEAISMTAGAFIMYPLSQRINFYE